MKTIVVLMLTVGTTLIAQPPGGGPGGGPGGPGGASGDGIWTRNAAFGELETFDLCNGHQPGMGAYHHHLNPVCLRAQLNDNVVALNSGRLGTKYVEKTSGWTHSPILGWSFDGYPVYGPYGYTNPADAKSPIRRVQTGFSLRNITQRHSLPAWSLPFHSAVQQNLTSAQYGPDVSAKFPLGRYVEDYDYVSGSGDLDQYNGRFTVTPEYPNGTYAYFVTLSQDGSTPVFPYIFNLQYYGTSSGGAANNVPSDAADYFANGALTQTASTDPRIATWLTKNSSTFAQAITGYDPSAGPSTTWPSIKPAGATIMGGTSTPTAADVQRVRVSAASVYVNSNNLPSYVIGPWFDSNMTSGVFMNWAAPQTVQVQFPRTPAVATTKTGTPGGAVGIWVNGVSIFNTVDGASYSNASGADAGGGGVATHAAHVSSASGESGPLAAGSLVTAYAQFDAVLATTTTGATGNVWPTSLGGTTVTVTDSGGAVLPAGVLYVSPGQVNYQMPAAAAAGFAKVAIASGGVAVNGNVNIAAAYPGIFRAAADGLAAAQTFTLNGAKQTYGPVSAVDLSAGQVSLILYGTGIGNSTVTATIGGVNATVAYSGPQGTYPGLDQVNLVIPPSLAGKGKVTVVLTAGGKASNPVYIVIL